MMSQRLRLPSLTRAEEIEHFESLKQSGCSPEYRCLLTLGFDTNGDLRVVGIPCVGAHMTISQYARSVADASHKSKHDKYFLGLLEQE
ncbi:MAG: hypothetical protein GF368_00085 [Candidatus Aenigmarchaeota archaeon]|nr:hypothetical protein [Candidatus Aenigmarchaeota archaeon]